MGNKNKAYAVWEGYRTQYAGDFKSLIACHSLARFRTDYTIAQRLAVYIEYLNLSNYWGGREIIEQLPRSDLTTEQRTALAIAFRQAAINAIVGPGSQKEEWRYELLVLEHLYGI